MKKILLLVALIATFATNVFADDYQYLTFAKSDGTTMSVEAQGLKITFSDGNLVATQGGETTTIALTDLTKMYFSSEKTGIESIAAPAKDALYNVVSVSGVGVGQFRSTEEINSQLPRGIYIVKKDGKSTKVIVR